MDHILSEDPKLPSSILYADVNDPSFGHFHQILVRTAKEGKTSYRVRYKPTRNGDDKPLLVNGYGVELALKRTDYIVIDDRESDTIGESGKVSEHVPTELDDAEISDLKPLSTSELLKLGVKATSFVMSNEDTFGTLLRLSQDFPKHSSAIAQHNISRDVLMELSKNQQAYMPAGYNRLWINGVSIDARNVNAFALLDHLRREKKLINAFQALGLSSTEAVKLLSHPAISENVAEGQPQRYDWRDEIEGGKVILWLNNLEKDKKYKDWPTDASGVLQRVYPGQLPLVRRDIHNLVLPVDFTSIMDVELVIEQLQAFVQRIVPIRIGLVPLSKTPAARDQAKVVYYLQESYGLSAALAYLQASLKGKALGRPQKTHFVFAIKERSLKKDKNALDLDDVLKDPEYDNRLTYAEKYAERLGVNSMVTPYLINGVTLPRDEQWLSTMSNRLQMDLRLIQRFVYEEQPASDTWLAGHFLSTASSRRNTLISTEDESNLKVIDIGKVAAHQPVFSALPSLRASSTAPKADWAQLIVVGNFDTQEGYDLLRNAILFQAQQLSVEVVFVHSSGMPEAQPTVSNELFGGLKSEGVLVESFREMMETQHTLPKIDADESGTPDNSEAKKFWASAQTLVADLGFMPGQQGLVLNGRVVGPIPLKTTFAAEDFKALLEYERAKRLQPVYKAMEKVGLLDRLQAPSEIAALSSLVAISTISDVPEGIFDSSSTARADHFIAWSSEYTAIKTGDVSSATFQVVAAVDPASEMSQRWIPILKVLSELDGVYLKLFLNPKDRLDELPVKRFYRHVLKSRPSFDAKGHLEESRATFRSIPKDALLTAGMDVPPSWLVAPKVSVHDLDNIKLSNLKEDASVKATYELESILIEGHSREATSTKPPRGAQLVLGTERDPHFADTIIMANLGYFQFKASPGVWKLALEAGRSEQVYTIDSAGTKGYKAKPGDESTLIELTSFQGTTLFPRLSRNAGQEDEDVLELPNGTPQGTVAGFVEKGLKMAQGILGNVIPNKGTPPAVVSDQADINIFSVASGHLYERMLNIMIVSVMRHTNHTVKFWFIEQFLSPSFKDFIPQLAEEYHFQYEMVTYKWPHWLRGQSEKQREIWGYKILFLDVLFPLSLDKVIFVDADQIVRTDMHDLIAHDLEGAVYGFTPMCDSRTEMEGFRFWKTGYWHSFLRGKPYHISALYVVDLAAFRAVAAGDRLRQQYQALSADPASLSNLDQDLPNHMQHALPIHSLPPSWLWCETWCSDEELADARTIDLCNNPLTKEPKLDRARRQVPEWNVYDEEIEAVRQRRQRQRRAREEEELGTLGRGGHDEL